MKLAKIDAYNGGLEGYIPLLDQLITKARRPGNYRDAILLCGGTRTICGRFEMELVVNPEECFSHGAKLKVCFESAKDALERLAKEGRALEKWQREHVSKMIDNVEHRIKILDVGMNAQIDLTARLTQIEDIRNDLIRLHAVSKGGGGAIRPPMRAAMAPAV